MLASSVLYSQLANHSSRVESGQRVSAHVPCHKSQNCFSVFSVHAGCPFGWVVFKNLYTIL